MVSTSTDAQGVIVTVTVTPTISQDSSAGTSTTSRNISAATGGVGSGRSNSFFNNTGAVAGTFTAVGVVALALLALIITIIIRRRRARKWDDEVAAAAAEAANSRLPVFLDDPDDGYGGNNNDHEYGGVAPSPYPANQASYAPSNGYNNVGNYSDASSHGTFGQPVMSHEGQHPEMSGPSPGGIFDHHAAYAGVAAGAGAAGIGVVRARSRGAETLASGNTRHTGPSIASGYAAGVGEGESPYPAFLAPVNGYDAYNSAVNQSYNSNGPDQRPIHNPVSLGPEGRTTHASAMASVAAAALAGTGSMEQTSGGNGPQAVSGESYASHYSGSGSPNRTDPTSRSPNASGRPSIDNIPAHREELPNPFTSGAGSDESDGEEEVPGRRVLKVANE